MSEWKEVTRGQAMLAVEAGTHEAIRGRLANCLQQTQMTAEMIVWPNDDSYYIREEKRMLTRTVTYPEPMTSEPSIGCTCWTLYYNKVDSITWQGGKFETDLFRRGLLWSTKEDAEAALEAFFPKVND